MIEKPSTLNVILDGAMQAFTRHGFVKTTMSDIASASGISRTSLYKHFSSKEAVFKALSNRINEGVIEAVLIALGEGGDMQARLTNMMNARVSWVYDLLHSSEYGRELINEKNKICGGDVIAANDRFQMALSKVLAEANTDFAKPDDLATLIIQSVNGVLDQAETEPQARSGVELLICVFTKSLKRE